MKFSARRGELAAVAGLVLLFALFKWQCFAGRHPVNIGDAKLWPAIAKTSLFSFDFWFAERPFTLPLFYKVFHSRLRTIGWAQCVVAVAAWSCLALSVRSLGRTRPGRVFAVAAVLGLGLTLPVNGWDFARRSESLSLSCLALLLAAVLRLVRHAALGRLRGLLRLGFFGALAGLFAIFARDSNAYLTLLLALVLTTTALVLRRLTRRPARRQGFRVLLAFAALLAALSVAAQLNLRVAERYQIPLMNVLFQRILPNPRALSHFERRLGMPVTPELRTLSGRVFRAHNWYAYKAPELEPFRRWLRRDGYAAYQKYLLTRPMASVRAVARALPSMVGNGFRRHLTVFATTPVKVADAVIVTGVVKRHPWLCLLAVLGAGGFWLARGRGLRRRLLGGFCLFVPGASLTQAFVAYHGDTIELARHALLVQLFLELGVLLVAFGLVDTAAPWVARQWGSSRHDLN